MRRFAQLTFAVAVVISLGRSAAAFNELGHYVIAKLAYDQLSQAQQQAICDILKDHPHYAEYLAANVPPGVTADEWAFLRAATWSDWIRRNHAGDYHKSEWHYINFPYRLFQSLGSARRVALRSRRNRHPSFPRIDLRVRRVKRRLLR